jgi:ABC-type lipoprotein release transport system permease subunit
MDSMFTDVSPFDPWTFGLVPAAFLIAAVAATLVPAWRATTINPVTAIRSE